MRLPDEIAAAAEAGDAAAVARWLDGDAARMPVRIDAREGQAKETLLMIASIEGHELLVTLLIGRGAALDLHDSDGRTALMGAALYGRLAVVDQLLLAGSQADLKDANSWTARRRAEAKGHDAIAQLLRRGSRGRG